MTASRNLLVPSALCLTLAATAPAQVPELVNYQGRLVDGTNLVNDDVQIVFRMYDGDTGGTERYAETQTVTVVDGLYSTTIGSTSDPGSLPDALTNDPLYLETEVDGTTLGPRERVTAVFRALQAARVVPGAITTEMLAPQAVTSNSIAWSTLPPGLVDGDDVGTGPLSYAENGTFTPGPQAIGQQAIAQGKGAEARADHSVVGGGDGNTVDDNAGSATVSGGLSNTIGTNSISAVIGGGRYNVIEGDAYYATLGGGRQNLIERNAESAGIGGGRSNVVGQQAWDSTIAGGWNNTIGANARQVTIGGGRHNTIETDALNATIGGGMVNTVATSSAGATIGGGQNNTVASGAPTATIGGGGGHSIGANAWNATVGGGGANRIEANAQNATIGGGLRNTVGTGAEYATIPGGLENIAGGAYAFAAGYRAQANHYGTFVWADGVGLDWVSTGINQFLIRADGGVGIGTTSPGEQLTVAGTIQSTSGGFRFPDGTLQTSAASTAAPEGDITSVWAGPGLLGGGWANDITLEAHFGGNGTNDTVARSDHSHDSDYVVRNEVGSISSDMIASVSVTANKLATDVSNLFVNEGQGDSITGGMIVDNAVFSQHIVDGTIGSGDIQDGSITSADLLNGGVGSADLSANAVQSGHIADGNVGSDDIAAGAVLAVHLGTGSVGSSQIADASIGSADLAAGSVGAAAIQNGSVGSAEIADGSIGSADLAAGSVGAAAIQNGSVGSAEIADGSVGLADIAQNAIVSEHLATGAVAYQDLAAEVDNVYVNQGGDTLSGNLNMGGWSLLNALNVRANSSLRVGTDQVEMYYSQYGRHGSTATWDPNPSSSNPGLWVEYGASESGGFYADGDVACIWSPGDLDILRVYDEDTLSAPVFVINSYSNVGIGTTSPSEKLDVVGNARIRSIGSGSYVGPVNRTSDGRLTTATSDARLKDNIATITGALQKVLRLRGVSFTWRDAPEAGRRLGLLAQEVEAVVPEAVFTNPVDGYKGVLYGELVSVLVEAAKDQQRRNALLQEELDTVKEHYLALEQRIAALEQSGRGG